MESSITGNFRINRKRVTPKYNKCKHERKLRSYISNLKNMKQICIHMILLVCIKFYFNIRKEFKEMGKMR